MRIEIMNVLASMKLSIKDLKFGHVSHRGFEFLCLFRHQLSLVKTCGYI